MKSYQLKLEDEDMRKLKVKAAQQDMSIKQLIIKSSIEDPSKPSETDEKKKEG